MMDQETRDKVAKLPVWARNLIKHLEMLPENLIQETAKLRKENSTLREQTHRIGDRCEAMTEIFRRAADGGNDYAAAVVKVLEGYEIFPIEKA